MILFQPIAVGIPLTIIPNLIIILRYDILIDVILRQLELINVFRRIYALYQRNKPIAGTLFAYCLAELAVALWIYLTPSVKRSASTEKVLKLTLMRRYFAVDTPVLDQNTPNLHSECCAGERSEILTYSHYAACLAEVSPTLYIFYHSRSKKLSA